jgi:hypothetical protein
MPSKIIDPTALGSYNASANADNTQALLDALSDAAAVNSLVQLPVGDLNFEADLVLPAGFSGRLGIFGSSCHLSRLIARGPNNGLNLDLTGGAFPAGNAVHLKDFALLASAAGAGPGVPSGKALRIAYPVTGTAPETLRGSIIEHLQIGTITTGNYASQYGAAGWQTGIEVVNGSHVSIDDVFGYGNAFDMFTAGAAGSGALISFLSGVNCIITRIGGFAWMTGISFASALPQNAHLPAGASLADCQGFFMNQIDFVGTAMMVRGIGSPGQYPNGLAAITVDNWQCDNGYDVPGNPYAGVFHFENASEIAIGAGLGILGPGTAAPAAFFSNCQNPAIAPGSKFEVFHPGSNGVMLANCQGAALTGVVAVSPAAGIMVDSQCTGTIISGCQGTILNSGAGTKITGCLP